MEFDLRRGSITFGHLRSNSSGSRRPRLRAILMGVVALGPCEIFTWDRLGMNQGALQRSGCPARRLLAAEGRCGWRGSCLRVLGPHREESAFLPPIVRSCALQHPRTGSPQILEHARCIQAGPPRPARSWPAAARAFVSGGPGGGGDDERLGDSDLCPEFRRRRCAAVSEFTVTAAGRSGSGPEGGRPGPLASDWAGPGGHRA